MASPFKFSQEWGGGLRPIEFPLPKPMLPSATITFLYYAGVPKRFEVTTYQRIRFDFLATAENLTHVWEREMRDWSFPVGWAGLWRIGDITYNQAAAWLCVEEVTGHVVAVHAEIDDRLYCVNGSIEGMVRRMKLVRDWTRSTDGSMTRVAALEDALSQDAALHEGEAKHYWRPLIVAAVESGCDKLTVEYE